MRRTVPVINGIALIIAIIALYIEPSLELTITALGLLATLIGLVFAKRAQGPPEEPKLAAREPAAPPTLRPSTYWGDGDAPRPELRYSNLFQIAGRRLPFVVLVGGWAAGANEFGRGDISVSLTDEPYTIPEAFRCNPTPHLRADEAKCRLRRYECSITGSDYANEMHFVLSKIRYSDYLTSGELLDNMLPDGSGETYRDRFAADPDLQSFTSSALTNICGVGVFVLTRDERIIVAKHTAHVDVYSGVYSFSASGTMDWGPAPHPFDEIARECREEIGHELKIDDTSLFEIGLDTKKLYVQFSFVERSGASAEQIISHASGARDYHAEIARLEALPFHLEALVNHVLTKDWEPAAAAGLLTLCAKRFGLEQVERAIDPDFVRRRTRDEMVAEWSNRAARPGDLAVMSTRYPAHRREEASQRYMEAAQQFIGTDINGCSVLEIGAGIGRFSEWLVDRAERLTCIDLSPEMLERNRQRLGGRARRVTYLEMFAEDYDPSDHHDVVISSLVLIHNVDEQAFRRLAGMMSCCAATIFLFEHVNTGSQVSSHTRPRSRQELLDAFPDYRVDRSSSYSLLGDRIEFLKLTRHEAA